LDLRNITLGKGRLFGPDDYTSFSILTLVIVLFLLIRRYDYKTNTFENLELVNIYNALKPAEINQIYEDNKVSPLEEKIMETGGILILIFYILYLYVLLNPNLLIS